MVHIPYWAVSILDLMDCRVKTQSSSECLVGNRSVSILDLMDCRVKTEPTASFTY